MKVLLLGSGGREHALAWKIAQSPRCEKLYVAPGNAGTESCAENVVLSVKDFQGIKKFVTSHAIDMLLVGPEQPLVEGLIDFLKKDPALSKLITIGPSAKGALLEGSKAFAKEFMARWQIPTAGYREFSGKEVEAGVDYISHLTPPVVLKADGLAAGKGVIISNDIVEAQTEFKAMLGGKFGTAGHKVVIEDFLDGIEFSVFVLTDGNDYVLLPIAKDYKRIGENDTGLNTGGMGAVSPVPFVDEALMQKVTERIIQPTITGLSKEKIPYKGFVFFGLIKVGDEPYVIEYNCRMGDPETEVVIPRIQSDLLDLFEAMHHGKLSGIQLDIEERAATTMMLVSGGYPEAYEKGKVISGIGTVQGSLVFHAGTRMADGQLLTNGGRVIAVTSMAENFRDALAISRKNAALIEFDGKYFRKDIGFDL